MFKLNEKCDADSLLYLLILNAEATRYVCSLNGIYSPTNQYSEVIIAHTYIFQSTLLGCEVTSIWCK